MFRRKGGFLPNSFIVSAGRPLRGGIALAWSAGAAGAANPCIGGSAGQRLCNPCGAMCCQPGECAWSFRRALESGDNPRPGPGVAVGAALRSQVARAIERCAAVGQLGMRVCPELDERERVFPFC